MEGRMQRRNFLATFGLAIAAPWSASAARPPRIGFLSGGDEKGAESFVTAMRDGLPEIAPWLERAAAADRTEDDRLGPDRRGDEMPEWMHDKEQRLAKIRADGSCGIGCLGRVGSGSVWDQHP
jgi:hypothetical protein